MLSLLREATLYLQKDLRGNGRYSALGIASRYDAGYTAAMKTAISIPDTIFQQAEKAAQQMKITRSELYAKAVAHFLERHHAQDITEKLNEVYAAESSALAPEFSAAQFASLATEEW
jgi:hypothetical protein